ncbi:MAG: universal stress protein [Pseudomonadota bacterium]
MAYKSIFTVVTEDSHVKDHVSAVMSFAKSHDAHLEVLALGVDRSHAGLHYSELSAAILQAGMEDAQTTANALAKGAEDVMQGEMLRFGVTPMIAQTGSIADEVTRMARFSDLGILPQPYGPNAHPDDVTVTEAALFSAGVPVLLLPDNAGPYVAPRRLLLGWNESEEAMAATRSAMPLLIESDTAYITIIDPPRHGPDRSDPGGLLSQYLARHGIRCEIDVVARTLPRIGDVLQRQIVDRDIDMVVMGAYGRPRWSEAMFGGATRQMLEEASVPVFMAR